MSEQKNQLFPDLPHQTKSESEETEHSVERKIIFKSSDKDQIYLFPESLDDYIGPIHIARFISKVIDGIDLSTVILTYKGGGASAYHPAILMKIWIFGWIKKIYTSRPLAAALTRDVEFMWIAERQMPSHMTLNDFRKRLGGDIKKVFKEIVKMAMSCGMIDGEEIFIDHTKIEADANKYKMVWRKQVEKRLEAIDAEMDKLMDLIDKLNDEEEKTCDNEAKREEALQNVDSVVIDELVKRINGELKAGEKDRATANEEKAGLRRLKELQSKKEEYEKKKANLGDRNSMSKTDPDAVAMMMKDKLSIKPGYNVGIATQNGIITGYDVSDNSNDGISFKAVMGESSGNLEVLPQRVVADAGYGTTENYQHLEKLEVDAYVKYPGWDRGTGRKLFPLDKFQYDQERDCYICPNTNSLIFTHTSERTNPKTGFKDETRRYEAKEADCSVCPLKSKCCKASARHLQVSPELNRLKRKANELLSSDKGKELRSRRSIEVETVFGVQKRDYRFPRFHVRGMTGATIESGLFYLSLNLTRMYKLFLDYLMIGSRTEATG